MTLGLAAHSLNERLTTSRPVSAMKEGRVALVPKLKMTLGLAAHSLIVCADNSGAKNLFMMAVRGIGGRLNKMPKACPGDMFLATVKKGKPELRKKVMPAIVI